MKSDCKQMISNQDMPH